MKHSTVLLLSLALSSVSVASAAEPVALSSASHETKSQLLGSICGQRTVLSENQMAPGIVQRVVLDSQGRVYKDMVKYGKVSGGRRAVRMSYKAPANATFYESFEGHAGELDWLPEGWTEINTPENKPTMEMCRHNINNTWNAQDTGDGYWTAITSDGVKECWIHFTYSWSYKNDAGETVEGSKAPQDEWLITPEITVGEADDLFFLAEVDLGCVYDYNWSCYGYDRELIDTELEVLVSVDGGENWDSLWKLSEDICAGMTDKELYDHMGELTYYSYRVPLADYHGKTVKIAFRYLTPLAGGNSMAVDAVTVAAPQPEAFYHLPDGTLLAGISDGLHSPGVSYVLLPADTPISWKGNSNAYTEKNSWAFYNEASGEMNDIVESHDAEISYPWSHGAVIPYPVLTATNANGSHSYAPDINDDRKGGMYIGGHLPPLADEVLYLGNYDYVHKGLVAPHFGNGSYCFGTAEAGSWGNGIRQTAIGNLFLAPSVPLEVTDVMLTLGEFDADDDAEITLEIYTVSADGKVSEQPSATSTVKGKDISGFGFYNAFFRLETPYEMSSHTLMMVKGFDSPKVRTFAACAQSVHNDDAVHNYAYMMFEMPDGSQELYAASDALTDYSSALYISLNGTFHVLKLDEEIVELDVATNAVEVGASATSSPEKWWVVDKANDNARLPLEAGGTTYDWLTVTPVTREDGSFAVRFSAPASDKQRSKTVYLSNGGTEARIRVKQPISAGIGLVDADESIGLTLNGDILSFSGMGADAYVVVYNADGRIVYAGCNNADTAGWCNGVYIVRCGTRTAKFMK